MYPDNPEKLALCKRILQKKARDNCRTPVQWTAEPHAGFTAPDSTPWMRVNDDYETCNAETQVANPHPQPGNLSVHAFWRRALNLRKLHKDVFIYGDFELFDPEDTRVVAWKRWHEKEAFVFIGNFSGEELMWDGLITHNVEIGKWVANNYDERALGRRERTGTLNLRPWEGLLGTVMNHEG